MSHEARFAIDEVTARTNTMGTAGGLQTRASGAMHLAEKAPDTAYLGFVVGSMALSALLFLARKRDLALFVGLWPPTLLNLVMLLKERRPSQELSSASRHQLEP